ncbi:MAG: hypothetical protein DCF15_22215 [Phormidesmis priestleyi]|uniref:Uncharacterized protein n=1 Tax=Phormidesmis priestleyi TaxID=268141 RepID=A0A2W4WHK6_9CYAN|nr:MAG: hypothetical protein DCF15_22215 [Phormidesmis priestleyi]
MSKRNLSTLITQEVKRPALDAEESSAIATIQNTPITELKLTSKNLFEESQELWQEFVAFDKEHQLTERVGAQLWRLTKAVGKPLLVLSIKGIQTAVMTVANPENRDALAARFTRSKTAQDAEATLEPVEK